MINPPSGTASLVVSLSAAVAIALTVINLSNVDQTDMIGTYTGGSNSNNAPAITVAANAGDLVFDSLAIDNVEASPTGVDQTPRAHHGNLAAINAVSSKPGTGVVQLGWSLTGNDDWAISVVNVRPFVGLVGLAPHGHIALPLYESYYDFRDEYTFIRQPLPPNASSASATASATASSSPVLSNLGSVGPRISLPPGSLTDDTQWKRQAANWMQEANRGHLNNTGILTLIENANSTTVIDERVGVDSFIGLMPRTANASLEKASGNIYIITGKQTFTIAHTNNATTDRTFTYTILG